MSLLIYKKVVGVHSPISIQGLTDAETELPALSFLNECGSTPSEIYTYLSDSVCSAFCLCP